METQPAAVTAGVPRQKLEFSYDAQSRRIAKKVSNWNGTAYVLASDTRFLYDGWNLIAELAVNLTTSTLTPLKTFTWGLDLSGSLQGAGGVGGLLSETLGAQPGTPTYFAAYDGNGNVSALVNAADGTLAAKYDYSAFGERVLTAGPAALLNPFRFSTKYEDAESGLLYYGFRYYNPQIGRWLNRDPLGEIAGPNMYAMVGNDPINRFDPDGLQAMTSFGPVNLYPGTYYQTYQWNPWRASHHEINLTFSNKNDLSQTVDSIYADLKKFNYFYPPNRGGQVEILGNQAKFSAPGVLFLLQAAGAGLTLDMHMTLYNWVDLSFDDASHMVTGQTVPGHILEGTRHWQVTLNGNCGVKIRTWAYERSLDWLVEGTRKLDVAIGPDFQNLVWHDYLTNIGQHWQGQGAKVSSVETGSP